ncbi:SRPBCC family protein [Streptomyces sp. NPDC040750]|uniref:SRPBCC family protein n=1 Tax=Streptomyces sp. NPDC040750 TaxID=3154491 RepID=UPI0033E6473D
MTTDTHSTSTSRLRHDPLVRGLGWASALLGVPQVAAPAAFARALGVGDSPRHRVATTAVGVRELTAATGLLGRPRPVWLWSRVGGDLMDLAALTRALKNHDGRGVGRTVAATAAVTAITATDVYAAVTRTHRSAPVELTATTTVNESPDEVHSLWSDLERLPDFMAHLDEVRVTGPRTSHWRASAPFGKTVEWDAEITQDVPGQLIAWRSVDGADVDNSGEVRFEPAPGDRGTEIRVTLRYDLPGGPLGKAAARYFGEEPHQQLDDDLRRFKQIAETGEVVRSEGAPGGKRARGEFPQHPARPLTEGELKEALA